MSKMFVSVSIISIVLFLGCCNAKTFLVKAKGEKHFESQNTSC